MKSSIDSGYHSARVTTIALSFHSRPTADSLGMSSLTLSHFVWVCKM